MHKIAHGKLNLLLKTNVQGRFATNTLFLSLKYYYKKDNYIFRPKDLSNLFAERISGYDYNL